MKRALAAIIRIILFAAPQRIVVIFLYFVNESRPAGKKNEKLKLDYLTE